MSAQKYAMGQRRRKNRRLIIIGILVLIVLIGGFVIVKKFEASTKPIIKNSAGSTHALVAPNSKTQLFDFADFSFSAPVDWKLIKHDTAPYNLYSYHSTLKNQDNRYLDIYIDSLPLTLAVNKEVSVKAQGNNLSHGEVSDNCTTFTTSTGQTAGGAKPLSYSAKWDGVEFICDNDNVQRNVVGTSSADSVNKVTLTGPTTGAHSFFFVYTDNNYNPDYTIFYNMLESLTVK